MENPGSPFRGSSGSAARQDDDGIGKMNLVPPTMRPQPQAVLADILPKNLPDFVLNAGMGK